MSLGRTEIAVSSGSACSSASVDASYVLLALGLDEALARTAIRLGLGRSNTEEEVDYVVEAVACNVAKLREMSPLYQMRHQEPFTVRSVLQ